MAPPQDQGGKRRPWNVPRAIRALEREIYRIDPDLVDEMALASERFEARRRFEARAQDIKAGRRKPDSEVERFERIGPAILELRELHENRDDRRELLVTLGALARKALPGIRAAAERFETALEPLEEMLAVRAQIEAERPASRRSAALFEEPRRLHASFNRLAAEIDIFATGLRQGYTPVVERLEAVRRGLIRDLRALGFSHARIAELVDPEGYEEDKDLAADRVRKELDRQRKESAQSSVERSHAELSLRTLDQPERG